MWIKGKSRRGRFYSRHERSRDVLWDFSEPCVCALKWTLTPITCGLWSPSAMGMTTGEICVLSRKYWDFRAGGEFENQTLHQDSHSKSTFAIHQNQFAPNVSCMFGITFPSDVSALMCKCVLCVRVHQAAAAVTKRSSGESRTIKRQKGRELSFQRISQQSVSTELNVNRCRLSWLEHKSYKTPFDFSLLVCLIHLN